MFCTNCGTPNSDSAAFCVNCGASLKKIASPLAENPAPVTMSAPVTVSNPVVEEKADIPSFFQQASLAQPLVDEPSAPIMVETPVEPAPVFTAPVEPAPVFTTPVEPAPVFTAPVEPAPVFTTPVEPAPVFTAPVEPAPVATTPAPMLGSASMAAAAINPTPVPAPEVTPVAPTPSAAPAGSSLFQQSMGTNPANAVNKVVPADSGFQGAVRTFEPGYGFSTSTDKEEEPKKKKKTGLIVGLISGGVAVALLVAGLFFFLGGRDDSSDNRTSSSTVASTSTSTSVSVSDPGTVVASEEANRTVMVYMIGSNLESEGGLGTDDINEMLRADSSDDFKIVLQTGGSRKWYNSQIQGGKVQRFEIKDNTLIELENLGAQSMVEKSTLTDFINYAVEEYPAKEYVLVMWNHGGSVPIGFGSDEMFDGELTDVEIGEAIRDTGVHFSSLIFNACEMCSLELFMSIKDSVDYVVAAESVIYGYGLYGAGIDYTSWINLAIQPNVSTQNYCETILDDYIDFLDEIGSKGSMSVIRMDRIQEVYDAYLDYISAAYNEIRTSSGYANYVLAREACGSYEGTDSVDISTLATKFENDYSNNLQNAVTNAVVRTKSDISFGHGITAYVPYDYSYAYDYGRDSLVKLGYDSTILACYDYLASSQLYYAGYKDYAGSWYVAEVEGGGNTSDVTVATSGLDNLTFEDMGGYQAVRLTDENWSIIKKIEVSAGQYLEDYDMFYLLGTDVQFNVDDNNYLVAQAPSYWLSLNEYFPTSICVMSENYDDGSWYDVYYVPATVNDKPAYIRVDSTSDNVQGVVSGYYITNEMGGDTVDDGHLFEASDVIQLYAYVLYVDSLDTQYIAIGDTFTGDVIYSAFKDINYGDDDVYVYFDLTDVYDNVYETDMVEASK